MKRVVAILTAALLVVLGLFLPHLTAEVQEQRLLGQVQQWENAAVSLTLAQEMVELPELDLFQSLGLFSTSATTMVELEEGRYTSAQEAAQTAGRLAAMLPTDVYLEYLDGRIVSAVEAVPYLLTDEGGVSGIFWKCSWSGRPGDEVIWIDDQSGAPVSFCLAASTIGDLYGVPIEDVLQAMFNEFFPSDISADVFSWDPVVMVTLEQGENVAYLSATFDGYYFYFNTEYSGDSSIPMAAAGIDSAGNESVLP